MQSRWAAIAAEEKVAVITTGAGNPSKFMEEWNAAGIKVIPVIASVAMAKLMRRLGAAAVIAEGGESGGHIGELSTMVLVPQVCDAIELPVIRGGRYRRRQRGGGGVYARGPAGSRWAPGFCPLMSAPVHQNYKKKILDASDLSTVVTGKRLGHPVRSLKTPFSRDYLKAENAGTSDAELEEMGVGAAFAWRCRRATFKKGCFLAGQIASDGTQRAAPPLRLSAGSCEEARQSS